jgi:uncharacterized RDD family membrane protein YckC
MTHPQEPLRDLTYGSLVAPQAYAYATQPDPVEGAYQQQRLVTPGGRFGAFLLDVLLVMVTLGIGYLIWSLIVWSNGQTPGKQLLRQVVVDAQTGAPADWGKMFMREFVIRFLLFGLIANVLTFGIFGIVDALMVFGKDNRTIHDKMAGTVVRYA